MSGRKMEKRAGPLPMLGRVKSKAGEAKSKWVDDIARAIVNATVSQWVQYANRRGKVLYPDLVPFK